MSKHDFLPEQEQAVDPPIFGRGVLYARIKQHIRDPMGRTALLFTGHSEIGKTAFLKGFSAAFPDSSFVDVYIPLSDLDCTDADHAMKEIIAFIQGRLIQEDFLSPEEDAPEQNLDDFLQRIARQIRSLEHLVLLFDDVQHLLVGSFDWVSHLKLVLDRHEQVTVVMTLATDYEDQINEFAPLVMLDAVDRIPRLRQQDSSDLVSYFAPGLAMDLLQEAYVLTGGYPRLVIELGKAIQKARRTNDDAGIIRVARSQAYATVQPAIQSIWKSRTQEEQLLLFAVANLMYDDPLVSVTTPRVESWLVETDYPMDRVSIGALLRSLEYYDILLNHRERGLVFTIGMMQSWVLEHSRLEDLDPQPESGLNKGSRFYMFMLVIGILILVLLLMSWLPEPVVSPQNIIPTVTLGS